LNSLGEIRQLRGPILRSVSRSFYLSIRLLPAKLRDPIALAYLLARATDTIADTSEISAELRARELEKLAARIQGADTSDDSLQSFVALQKNEAERALIQAVPACLGWLRTMPKEDRADITAVLSKINEGQTFDVTRSTLKTDDELERYTYLVAGCVGEFWTSVCFRHLPEFAKLPKEKMYWLGVEYGKGLQLINILRDVSADQRAGRSYLPNLDPKDPLSNLARWQNRADEGIAAGIEYSRAIRSKRVRLATILPALIGARTLALLREAGAEVYERRIKISRAEVRQIILKELMNYSLGYRK
jgi:farnesyl-diphosphate farnesyltransferase